MIVTCWFYMFELYTRLLDELDTTRKPLDGVHASASSLKLKNYIPC